MSRKPTLDQIVEIVSQHFRVSADDIMNPVLRKRQFTRAKRAVFYLASKHAGFKVWRIAFVFERDHGAVTRGRMIAADWLQHDDYWGQKLRQCELGILALYSQPTGEQPPIPVARARSKRRALIELAHRWAGTKAA